MKTIKEFVAQIISGDNIGARETFQSLVAEKSMEALSGRKQEIAQTLFQTEETNLDEEELDEALANWNNSAGEFQHGDTKKWFTYKNADHPWAEKHNLPHQIAVGPNAEETRFAHVKGTVAHVAVDENPDGTPKLEKWTIKNHSKHVREGVEIEEGNAENKQKKNDHFDKMGAKWKELNPQHDFPQNPRTLGRGVNAYGNKKQVKAAQQTEEFEQVDEEKTLLKTSNVASLYGHENGDHSIVRNRDGKQIHYGTKGSATKLWNQLYAKDVKKDVKEEFEQVDESGGINRAMKQLANAKRNSTKDNDPAVVGAANKAYHKYRDSKARERLRTEEHNPELDKLADKYSEQILKARDSHYPEAHEDEAGYILKKIKTQHGHEAVRYARAHAQKNLNDVNRKENEKSKADTKANYKPTSGPAVKQYGDKWWEKKSESEFK